MASQLAIVAETRAGIHPAPNKISFRGVSKGFSTPGGWVRALDDFSLDIAPGEFVCLVGPSGCGKTTALNLAAGFFRPDAGAVVSDGAPVLKAGPERMVVFQEQALFPWMTVRGNVELGLQLAGKPRKERQITAAFWLRRMNLDRFQNAYIYQLSGGMKQRAQLARALALSPAVLLMDEPFAALDALTKDMLYAEFQTILSATHQTVLFITHNVREAAVMADRIVVMGGSQPGRVRGEFTVDLQRPRDSDSPGVTELSSKALEMLKGDEG